MNQAPGTAKKSPSVRSAPTPRCTPDGGAPADPEFSSEAADWSPTADIGPVITRINQRVEVFLVVIGVLVGLSFVLSVPAESMCEFMFALSVALVGGGVLAGLLSRAERSGRRRPTTSWGRHGR